jgi:hypothetical protein
MAARREAGERTPRRRLAEALTHEAAAAEDLGTTAMPAKRARGPHHPPSALAPAQAEPAQTEPVLLGKGMFGCVFSPPLACADGRFAEFAGDATKVSKYGPADEIAHELAVYPGLDRMDPEFRFHLRVYGGCRAEGTPACETDYLAVTEGSPRKLIFMDRAGPSLEAAVRDPSLLPANAQFVPSVENLVRALAVMADRGLVYGDLTAENVVFGPHDGLLRIIDFNRAQYTDPEQARGWLYTDLEAAQDRARDLLELLERRIAEGAEAGQEAGARREAALLRAFIGASLAPRHATADFTIERLVGGGA